MSAFLILLAGIFVVSFIIVKISDPGSEKRQSKEEMLNSLDPEKSFNFGSLFL